MQVSLVERRREQEHQPVLAADQILVHRFHRFSRPLRIGASRNDRPRLRQRIDAAFRILR